METVKIAGKTFWVDWAFGQKGLSAMVFGLDKPDLKDLAELEQAADPALDPKKKTAWQNAMKTWLKNYGKKNFQPLPVPLDTSALGPFQAKVVNALVARVPPGTVVSYGELAALAGSPRAARAVGGTMASHPMAFAVPCHRVLHSAGSKTRYGKGVLTKLLLLRHEGFDTGRLSALAKANGIAHKALAD